MGKAVGALQGDGLGAQVLRTAPAFGELRVSDGAATCIVDLVAEPFGSKVPPDHAVIDGATIAVDSRHELLASKLATLLERSEIRDLADVKALLDAGGDFESAKRRTDEGRGILGPDARVGPEERRSPSGRPRPGLERHGHPGPGVVPRLAARAAHGRGGSGIGTSQSAGCRVPIAVYARHSMAVLLTNASIVPSGDHEGTLIVPCPP